MGGFRFLKRIYPEPFLKGIHRVSLEIQVKEPIRMLDGMVVLWSSEVFLWKVNGFKVF